MTYDISRRTLLRGGLGMTAVAGIGALAASPAEARKARTEDRRINVAWRD